jgi:hypothetical protein
MSVFLLRLRGLFSGVVILVSPVALVMVGGSYWTAVQRGAVARGIRFLELGGMDKVRDVVGQYRAPPENALVLAMDEKSQMEAIGRTAPI